MGADETDFAQHAHAHGNGPRQVHTRSHGSECDVEMKGGNNDKWNDDDEESDVEMEVEEMEEGWGERHTELWIEFMKERQDRGVSKDTWQMVSVARDIWSNHFDPVYVGADERVGVAARTFHSDDRCRL